MSDEPQGGDAPSPGSPARAPGPPQPTDVRSAGDPTLCAVLEQAVAVSGRIERATHGFHTYPAGLHPDSARLVIEACPGRVHDPFCGGGTVLIEALLAGRKASGTDLSPVALLVATARTAKPELATPMRSAARKLTEGARLRIDVEVPEALHQWYEPHVAQELGRLRDGIARVEDKRVQMLLRAVFSSIVVKASHRESDTSNRRKTTHRPPGTTAILFHKKARELGRMMAELPPEAGASIRRGDARFAKGPPNTGLVLTSPPYPGVYDYLPMQQLRTLWLGLDTNEYMNAEVGSRRSFRAKGRPAAFRQWREDTTAWIETASANLAPEGRLGIMVGDGLVGGRLVDALGPTVEAMRAAGLQIVARASADRPDHARDAIRIEHLVLGQKD